MTFAQTAKVLRSDLSIKPFYKFENIDFQPRFVYDPTDKSFYAISWSGGLFHLTQKADGSFQNQRIASASDHAINYLQGLALLDGTIYLVGNVVVQQGVKGYGKAVKAKINSGSLKWVEVFKTAEHAASNTLFDHSFSSICFLPDGKDMFIASGSRTDHGEVKDHEGKYPKLREIALKSCICKLPTSTENLFLPDDSTKLAPYVYTRGVRITTLAGQPTVNGYLEGKGDQAKFYHPQGSTLDKNGDLYVTDSYNSVIRKLTIE